MIFSDVRLHDEFVFGMTDEEFQAAFAGQLT
jgi:hypothetical protein